MRWDSLVTVDAPLVFAGYGIVAPEYEWNDYAGVDVKGKIVAVLVNDPGLYDPAIFKGKVLTYYARWTYKFEEAARQGAAGVLLIHTDESATYPWGTVEGSATGKQVRLETAPTSLQVTGWIQHDAMARAFAAAGDDLDQASARAGKQGFVAYELPVRVAATVRSHHGAHRHLQRPRAAPGHRRPPRPGGRRDRGALRPPRHRQGRWTATRSTTGRGTTPPGSAKCSPSRRR